MGIGMLTMPPPHRRASMVLAVVGSGPNDAGSNARGAKVLVFIEVTHYLRSSRPVRLPPHR